jgi:hypothetical protein
MQDVVGMVFDDIIINRTVLLAPFRAGLYIHVRHNGLPLLFHLLKYIHAAKSPAVADVSSFGQVLLSLRLPACEAGRVANCFHRRAGAFPADDLQVFFLQLVGCDEELFQFLSDGL